MIMFYSDSTANKYGKELYRQEALLHVALAPVSSQTGIHTSWANVVSSVSYLTHMGPVDIAKVEEPDHSFKGYIKVSGLPDDVRQGTVWKYPLPTSTTGTLIQIT